MDKQIITFSANEQILRKTGGLDIYASKTVSYIEAHFDLGQNWSGYDSIEAVWWNDYVRPVRTVLDTEGKCIVPAEVLMRKSVVYVNLVGVIASGNTLTDRLTTHPITALTNKFNAQLGEGTTTPLTPSEYEQFVATVKADADRAEDAKDSARVYAGNALSSAQNALVSETNASTSETNAHTSEVNAKASEDNAETYKSQAQTYAQNADISATNAENAKDEAIDARDEILGMSATATTLPAGSNATASYSDGLLSLGIPKGDKGDKGNTGDTGAPAGFGSVMATVDDTIGTPSVEVTASGADTAKNFDFAFHNLKGEKGDKGDTGEVSYADLKSLLPMDTASGAIVSITDGQSVIPVESLKVSLEPIQDLHGYDKPWSAGAGANIINADNPLTFTTTKAISFATPIPSGTTVYTYASSYSYATEPPSGGKVVAMRFEDANNQAVGISYGTNTGTYHTTLTGDAVRVLLYANGYSYTDSVDVTVTVNDLMVSKSPITAYSPYSNICPISGHTEVDTHRTGKNLLDNNGLSDYATWESLGSSNYAKPLNLPKDTQVTISGQHTVPSGMNSYVYLQRFDGTDWRNIVTLWQANVSSMPYTFTTDDSSYRLWAFNPSASIATIDWMQIELGSTATDYEPYEGTTYTTELEGNYTVVGTDKVPYLFKPVGDVDGDRLREKIVGGSVGWNQLVNQSVVQDKTFPFTINGITVTLVNNRMVFNGTATGDTNLIGYANIKKGHKYFRRNTKSNAFVLYDYYELNDESVVSAGGDNAYATTTIKEGTVLNNYPCCSVLHDLTQMFGSTIADYIYSLEQATAGSGVAWLKQNFPKMFGQYNPYDAGSIQSVSGLVSHDTVGKNLFDKTATDANNGYQNGVYIYTDGSPILPSSGYEWNVSEFIKALPNTTYTLSGLPTTSSTSPSVCQYNAEKQFIIGTAYGNNASRTITTDANCAYVRISIPQAYIDAIQLELSSTATAYEPYQKWSYPLDSALTLRGIPKLDNGDLYYDGDTYESDGTVTRKYGIVDLGTLTWAYSGGTDVRFYSTGLVNVKSVSSVTVPNMMCGKLRAIKFDDFYANTTVDKTISYYTSGNYLFARDLSTTDPATFKAAMNGVYLVYELAEPTTETAEPFEAVQKMVSGGTLQYVTDSIVPVGHDTEYLSRVTYGGVLDVVSGELVVDRAMVDMGNLNWTKGNRNTADTGAIFYNRNYNEYKSQGAILSSAFETVTGLPSWEALGVGQCISAVGSYVVFCADYDSAASFKTAMSGVQLCYELATPTTIQLTPQEVKLLLGNNTIWSDGDVAIVYSADVTKWIEKQLS